MITAIFDGQCVICQASKRVISALDWLHRVEWLDLHDWSAVHARFPSLEYDDAMGQIYVYDDQRVYAGFFGVKRLLKVVPLGFPLWLLMQIPGMTAVGQCVYRWIARNRYTINRLLGVNLTDDCEAGVCKIS